MPVSFLQIRTQVKEFGPQALKRREELKKRIDQALGLLEKYANCLNDLRQKVEAAQVKVPDLRSAVPGDEALNQTTPCPAPGIPVVILAADGSQINPDRHNQVEFGLINTGAFCQRPREVAEEFVESKLLFGDDLELEGRPMTDEYVALLRDLSERTMLAALAEKETLPVITLTDGQLELFREPQSTQLFKQKFDEYTAALRRLCELEAVTAGYVDRPRADLVVRLLELTLSTEYKKTVHDRPLRGVTDAHLYERYLQPGERSPVFAIQSASLNWLSGNLALHFFFINVGNLRRPNLARVEIPAWVADNPQMLACLHAALVEQCQPLANRPYPYAIHRAHEVAVVGFAEKEQITNMIAGELLALQMPLADKSNKQIHKDSFGKRTRSS